jgi:tetratricopeptide (TPR) repeat protein
MSAAITPAAEPQKEILDGLRAKGHYDEAIDYLRHARANSSTPKTFAETIDYELAVTQIDAAAGLAEPQRDQPLQLAQEALTKFLADQPRHALAAAAQGQLGNVLFDRGRLQRILAEQYEGQTRQKYLETARGLLRQAGEHWARIDKAADEELKRIVFVRGNDIKRSEARDEIHRRQLQARLAQAWVQYEMGQTDPSGSPERTAAVQEAGNRFDKLFDQQRERLAGFYARLGRGLCCKDLGESARAFAIFEELLLLPDDPADFHAVRGKAAVQAIEISLRPEVKKYKQGLDIAQRWIGRDRLQSASSDVIPTSAEVDLAIRFLGGEAAMAYVKTLPAASLEQSGSPTQQINWARQQFNIVAATAGPYQAKAKIRLLDPALGPAERSEPGTLTDDCNRAKAALDRFLTAQAEQKAAMRSGVGNDHDSQRQRQEQIATAQSEALKFCRLALDQRATATGTAQPPVEEYDTVRYYLAYLRYASGELDEAAALGEAMAQASSDSPAARQAARIGLAAREALCRRATDESRPTAIERLQVLAEKIIERWGNRSEADDARGILLDLALGDGQLEKADQYLQQISDSGPCRGEAELNLGRALWQQAQYLLRTSTLEHDHTAEAEKIIARATRMLSDGIARCRKAIDNGAAAKDGGTAAGPALPAGMLALAQIHMTEGRPAEAIVLLEDPGVAAADSHSLALLAYVATGQLDKARICLQKLQSSLPPAGSAGAAREMLQTCLRINRLLKRYLAAFHDRRQDDLVQKIVQHFDDFLASSAEAPAADSFFVLAWRAEAYAGLAEGLDIGGPGVLPEADKLYRRAVAAFREILDRAATKADFSPAAEVTVALRIELARCLRRLSDNSQALSQLLAVLEDHPRMVDAQIEAAYTYQSWGDEKPEYLEMAIQGGKRYQQVWGWGELARQVQSEPRFRDVFYEARYNLALCRFRQAQIATDRPQRAKLSDAAENDILATRRLFPDMGGAVWYDRYNELLKRIQRLADRPVVGLTAP